MDEEKDVIAKSGLAYANLTWQLTVTVFQQVADHVLQRYSPENRMQSLKYGTTSLEWVKNFILRRTDLHKVSIRTIEDPRFKNMTPATISETLRE